MRIVYVRFGALPEDGKSRNALTGELEAGVSVYEALERDGQYQILLPKMDPQAIATLGNCFNVAQGLWGQEHHPLHLVEGEVVGKGSDGETLLANCRVVRRIFGPAEPFFLDGEKHTDYKTTRCCEGWGKPCKCGGFMHYQPVMGSWYYECEMCHSRDPQ